MSNNNGEYVSVEQFEDYLHTTLAESTNDELMYVRTNVVAEELNLSRQQVGQLFIRHKSRSESFDIERRSKSNRSGQGAKWEMRLNETRDTDTIVCDECGQSFDSQQALYGHRRVHQSNGGPRE